MKLRVTTTVLSALTTFALSVAAEEGRLRNPSSSVKKNSNEQEQKEETLEILGEENKEEEEVRH
eukprot:6238534-Ditylum_brightwellii.AAC.1